MPVPSGGDEPARDCLRDACRSSRTRAEVAAADWLAFWHGRLDWPSIQMVEQQAPASYLLPSGRAHAIDYQADPGPVLRVRIQELFGCDAHPSVDGQPLVLQLLAPNDRVQQITTDLPGFWRGSYQQVRKDLRGRYSKHPWPEDPITATAWWPGQSRSIIR